jgi:3-oxoacyl-[acyl-carrier protein] reductase
MVGLLKARAETEGINPDNWQSLMAAMPMGRAARVEEVGDVVAFLISDRAGYVSGTVVNIDGGGRFRG